MSEKKELNVIYWRGLFIPIVISILVLLTILVFVTTNVGEPHKLFSFNPPSVLTKKY
jgi:hypothetical protein